MIIKEDLVWSLGPDIRSTAISPSSPSSGAPLEDVCCLSALRAAGRTSASVADEAEATVAEDDGDEEAEAGG